MPREDGEADRWARIEEICFGAMQCEPDERASFLDQHCGSDARLRREIEGLLAAADTRPDFLERPVIVLPTQVLLNDAGVTDAESGPGGGPGQPPVSGAAPGPDDVGADGRGGSLPSTVGPYRIVRPIGEGGMGHVYLAVREGDGFSKTVALKVVRKGLDTERVLERFREERRILAGLSHPNIAALIDGGATADGRPYFVMEYVEGEPIDAYCERRGLSVRDRLRLVRTVCDAVHHAHQNLVVHRDIKPPNILVTPSGVPKLLDFGIGKVLATDGLDPELTVLEERPMTPEYAAPEQREGRAITTATDVYALGVLLYRLLTDQLPWSGREHAPGAPTQHRPPPPRPSEVASERRLSTELDAVILKALRVEPDQRYPGALALADDLDRFMRGLPVAARPPGVLYLARKFIGRNRVAVAASLVLAAGVLSGTAYTWLQSQRVAAERDKALEVRGFLLETFGAASPDQAGDPVTARALLDGQAATVTEAYADDPALRAEMMLVLAEGYERLGLLEDAEEWARRVVDDRAAGLSEADQAAAQTLLAWVLHQRGASSDAAALLERSVTQARAARGAERVLARSLNDLGVVREALGDYEEAGTAHEEALRLRAELFGPDHRSVAVSASNLAAIHYRRGDFDRAVAEAERALAIIRTSFGPDHQRAIIVQSNLAVFKLVQGDLEGAEADYRDLLERQRRVQGPDHPVTVRVMMSLASVLRQAEKWSEAETVLRRVLDIADGPDANPVDVAFTMATLGDVVSARGAHSEAIVLLEESMRLQIDAVGANHVGVAQSQGYLSRAYERVDSLGMAEAWQARSVAILESSLGPDHPQTMSERNRLNDLRSLTGAGRE